MPAWKQVITNNDDATYKNASITLAQLFAGLDGNTTATANQILKVNGDHDALEWGADTGYTDAEARLTISVTDSGEAGSLAYNNSTGVISYTGATKAELDVDHLITLSGVSAAADNLGDFTGSTITSDGTVKAGMQLLETSLELKQTSDAGLTSIAGLTTAADKMIYTTGSDTYNTAGLTSAGRAILDDASASAQRTTLGLAIGSNVQAYDAQLDTVAGWSAAQVTTLGTIATVTDDSGQMIYTTAADTFAATDITAAGRGFLAGNGVAGLQDYIDMAPSDSPSFTDLTLTGGDVTLSAATTIALTNHTVASGQKVLTIKGSESKTTETDLAGSDVVIEGGNSTGTASGGDILFKIYKPHPSTSSDDANSVSTALTIDATDASVTFAANATVTGDLTVSGTTTTINTETINLADNVINLNSNAANGDTKPADGVDAGLTIERGNWINTEIFWDESDMCWKTKADSSADTNQSNSNSVTQTILSAEVATSGSNTSGTAAYIGSMYLNTNTTKLYIYM